MNFDQVSPLVNQVLVQIIQQITILIYLVHSLMAPPSLLVENDLLSILE